MIVRKALLGFLALKGPRSGYDLKKCIEGSIAFFYHAGFGQIYPELNKMESEGLVEVEKIEQETRPAKKVYSITAEGRRVVEEWLSVPADLPVVRSEFLMQVFFSPVSERDALIRNVEKQLALHRLHLEEIKNIERGISESERHLGPYFTIRCGLAYSEMFIEWCEWVLKKARSSGSN